MMTTEKIDCTNKYLVGANATHVTLVIPPVGPLTFDDALLLAAWLVAIAEQQASNTFDEVLAAVCNT